MMGGDDGGKRPGSKITQDDIIQAQTAERLRHGRELNAIHIAAVLGDYGAADRAEIRRRVQELLRCKDEPLGTVPLTEDQYAPPYRWAVHGSSGRLWTSDDVKNIIESAGVPIFGTEHNFTLVRRTKDAILKEFGLSR